MTEFSRDGTRTNGTSFSEDTVVAELESQRANLNSSNPRGTSHAHTGVDVAAAERDFEELSRQLSGLSRSLSRRETSNREKVGLGTGELEAGEPEDDGTFDLETHLRGVEDEERRAGIKPKKIGLYTLTLP